MQRLKLSFNSSVKDAILFYKRATHCPVTHEDSYTKALALKKGLPYKRIMLGNDLDHLGLLSPDIRSFYARSAEVYAIPLDDPSTIRGLLLRSVRGKDFRIVSDGFPFLFGLFNFSGFTYGDLIILTEGMKDALAVSSVYPYSLAVLGNHVSVKQASWLKKLTDNYVFIGDSDVWGRRAQNINLKAGCRAVYFFPESKDAGELFERENTEILSYIKSIVAINKRRT